MERTRFDPELKRLSLVKKLESELGCRVVTYICGDSYYGAARIADDAVPRLYEHLQGLQGERNQRPQVALYLYARGGQSETPWKVVTLFRELTDGFTVVVPFKAYSATTMIAIGADKVYMHEMGELGPVDPSLYLVSESGLAGEEKALPSEIGVEDISAFLRFLQNRAGITDQASISQLMATLTQALGPALLGRIERVYSHSRLVASKLLALQRPPLEQDLIGSIVEALTEKCYVHGHAIRRREARELGLRVEDLSEAASEVVWDLYKDYETTMALDAPSDPNQHLGNRQSDEKADMPIAFIESEALSHAFVGTSRTRRILKTPQDVQVHLNLNVPPDLAKEVNPEQIAKHLMPSVQKQIDVALARQSQVARIERTFTGRWVKLE